MEFLQKIVTFKLGNDFYLGKAVSYNKENDSYIIDKPMNLSSWHELKSNIGHRTEKKTNLLKLYKYENTI